MRDRLETFGLVPFCKTTGGKGLHIVTPLSVSITERSDWPTAKTFARKVSVEMAADSPDRYVVTIARKASAGGIFLYDLNNDLTQKPDAPHFTCAGLWGP